MTNLTESEENAQEPPMKGVPGEKVVRHAIAFGVCCWLIPAIDYAGGLAGLPLPLLVIPLPAEIAPFLGMLWFGARTLIGLVDALRRKQFRRVQVAIAICVVSIIGPTLVLSFCPRPFLVGLRHHVSSRISDSDLRQLALLAQGALTNGDNTIRVARNPLDRLVPRDPAKYNEVWAKLESVAGIGKLNEPFWLSVNDSAMTVSWGGALTGHYGFIVGPKAVEASRNSANSWVVEPDIVFVMGPN